MRRGGMSMGPSRNLIRSTRAESSHAKARLIAQHAARLTANIVDPRGEVLAGHLPRGSEIIFDPGHDEVLSVLEAQASSVLVECLLVGGMEPDAHQRIQSALVGAAAALPHAFAVLCRVSHSSLPPHTSTARTGKMPVIETSDIETKRIGPACADYRAVCCTS